MPESGVIERAVFYTLAVWQIVLFYFLGAASLGIFFYGAYGKIRKYLRGRKQAGQPLTWQGLAGAAAKILVNRTILRGY